MQEEAIVAAARALMPEWQGQSVEVLGYLQGGYSHDNYRLRVNRDDFALRLPKGLGNAQRQFERWWWQQLPEGVSAELLRYSPQTGHQLTRWADGTLLVHAELPSPEQLARYAQRLHQQLPDPKRTYDLGGLFDRWIPTSHATESARRLVDTLPAYAACHNDLNPWNIICGADRWVTLDWEMVGTFDPLFDVVALGAGLELSDVAMRKFADCYLEGPVPEDRYHAAQAAFWLREYAWAENAIATGNDRQEVVAQRDSALLRVQSF